MTVFQVFEFCATFVEALIGIMIIAEAAKGNPIKWKENLIASGLIAIIVWGFNQYQLFSVMTSLVSAACLIIGVWAIYRTNVANTIILTATYMVLLYVIDFLSISFLGVFFQSEQIAEDLTKSFSYVRIGLLVMSKGILWLIYVFVLKKYLKKVDMKSSKLEILVLLMILTVLFFIKITFSSADVSMAISWTLLLILIMLGIYMLAKYSIYKQKQNELELAMERNALITENYEKMILNFQKNRLFYHDLQNQYLIIENYLKNEKYVKAKEYIEELKGSNKFTVLTRRTGIEGLDILLSCKKREAESKEIRTVIVADLIDLHVNEQDIIALVGNAFDNAIEACKKMDSDRWIQVTIRNVNGITFIKISNSYKEPLLIENDKLISRKMNNSLHGLGMLSMQVIVDKYQGKMSVHYENNIFTVTVSFFY